MTSLLHIATLGAKRLGILKEQVTDVLERALTPKDPARPECVWIKNGCICFSVNDGDATELPISEIQIVAEYTTPSGPYMDDYFLVLAVRDYFYTVSFYARGQAQLLSKLSEELAEELEWALCGSTDWKSRVIWPPEIRDQPFFDILPAPKPVGMIGKLKYRLLSPVELHLTAAVRDKLNPTKPDPA